MRIEVYKNDVGKAYKILQKKLNNEGVLKKLKEKEFYLSKGENSRVKRKRAIARWKKQEKKLLKALERSERFQRRRSSQTNSHYSRRITPIKANKKLKHT
jgi:ribosomal protein S21